MKLGRSQQAATFFLTPHHHRSLPEKRRGYIPISHHDTLDGLHVLRPVVEDSAWGKGKSGQGKQPADTGKFGYQILS